MKLWVSIIIFIMSLFFLIIVNKINRKNKKLNITVNILSISVMVLCLLYIILTLILVDSKKYDQDSKYTDKAIEIAKSNVDLALFYTDQNSNSNLSKKTYNYETTDSSKKLTSEQKKVYDEVLGYAKNFEYHRFSAKELGYEYLDNVLLVLDAIYDNYPIIETYFKIDEHNDGNITDYLETNYFMPGDKDSTPVTDIEKLKEEIEVFKSVCKYVVSSMNDNYSAYDKYKYLASYISIITSYDYSGDEGWQDGSIYGAILSGHSICEGYSKAFKYLCKLANLYCECVNGTVGDVSHMWNIVKLDSGTYYIDVTWADDDNNLIGDEGWLKYFMVTEEDILRDHEILDGTSATGKERFK